MSRLSLPIYLAGALIFIKPIQAIAQSEPVPASGFGAMPMRLPTDAEIPNPDSADYDSRALRFENHRGTIRILQGQAGAVVGKAEWFKRLDLASIVAPSERALTEARGFSPNRAAGMWAVSLGLVVFALDGIIVKVAGGPNAASVVTALGSSALMAYGAGRLDRASEALSKSVWWYNRDLKK